MKILLFYFIIFFNLLILFYFFRPLKLIMEKVSIVQRAQIVKFYYQNQGSTVLFIDKPILVEVGFIRHDHFIKTIRFIFDKFL